MISFPIFLKRIDLAQETQGLDTKDEQIKELTKLVNKLMKHIEVLEAKVEKLENQLARYQTPKNSTNSSVPPSKDENRPMKSQSLRKSSGKKSGGQPGHKGHTLKMSATSDHTIKYIPQFCGGCGNDLGEREAILELRAQEIDLPLPKTITTEHQTYRKNCQCGHVTTGRLPEHLKAPVQYGSGVEAIIGYLHARQYLPYQRLCEILSACFGLKISQGSIDNIIQRLSQKAEGIYERIRHEISQAPVVGSDETGAKINGKKSWVWTWQSDLYTYISVSPSRGYSVIKEEFPEGLPNAILCHDAWKPHFKCPARTHQLCLAHLLRELEYLEKRYDHPWSTKCKKLFLDSLKLKNELLLDLYKSDCPQRLAIEKRMDRLLQTPIDKKHKELLSFSKRLKKYRENLFVFLYHEQVPADNNGSERAIRNVKVKQKISGQFKSFRGAQNFVTLRSLIDTLIKQSLDILPNLQLIAKLTPE